MKFYDTPGQTYDSGILYDDVSPLAQPKIMAKVKFTFKGISDEDTLQACNNLKTALTGNANFPTPPVSLATFGTKITSALAKLTAANNAAAASKQATADKDTEFDALKAMGMQNIGYVDLTANGSESMILSAGLPVRAAKSPQTIPGQVQNLSLTAGDNEGSLDVHWDHLANAKSYEVQSSPDPFTTSSFVTRDTVTKSATTLTGFTSGARIWVRVRAINSAGKGPWSDPSVKTVP
ncbi:MAG: fibronectin type III domain-containing protein [Verrucomicrobiota bacterium]